MVSPCARSKQRTSNETKRAPHHRFAAQSRDETEDDVSEHHAENKHRAEEQRFALITSFGHVGQRYWDRSQSHRIEAERKAGKESDARRCEARMFYRRAQRLCLHHARPRFRSINDLRSCTTVSIEVKTTSPSMTIEGSVMTPDFDRVIDVIEDIYFTPLNALYRRSCRGAKLGLPIPACETAGAIEQFDLHRSLYRRREVRSFQCGDDRALLHRLLFVCTFCNQLIERLGHRFHRPNFLFDLQLLFDRARANVAAAGLVASA